MAYTTINKSTDYFNTKLYNGNSSTQSITGVGFQPDFVWGKARSGTDAVYNHALFDAVRGANKWLRSNNTSAEVTATNMLTSFDSDGFSLGNDGHMNLNGNANVAWNWKANGAGSSNSDGSVTSTVSANTTAGFSIVTWTSTGSAHTVGHGLGSTPAMIIMKGRHEANSWMVYHHKNTSAPETEYLELHSTNATADWTTWNDTAPTNSVFSLGTWSGNDAGGTMVAYCFAEKTGYSKFGSYTGNGGTDGPFVYTGFKPAFLLLKESTSTDNWLMMDNKRLGYNNRNDLVFANLNNAEQGHDRIDLLSNGFKMNNDDGSINQSGQTYVYMSFGQSLVGSNNVPSTAR